LSSTCLVLLPGFQEKFGMSTNTACLLLSTKEYMLGHFGIKPPQENFGMSTNKHQRVRMGEECVYNRRQFWEHKYSFNELFMKAQCFLPICLFVEAEVTEVPLEQVGVRVYATDSFLASDAVGIAAVAWLSWLASSLSSCCWH